MLDPGSAPGTGYPEPGGISYYQLKEALLLVAQRYDVIGLDLTEVNPIYDAAGVTPRIAAKLLLDVLGGVFASAERLRWLLAGGVFGKSLVLGWHDRTQALYHPRRESRHVSQSVR